MDPHFLAGVAVTLLLSGTILAVFLVLLGRGKILGASPDDRALDTAIVDAITYGIGVVRRLEDGTLERVDPRRVTWSIRDAGDQE